MFSVLGWGVPSITIGSSLIFVWPAALAAFVVSLGLPGAACLNLSLSPSSFSVLLDLLPTVLLELTVVHPWEDVAENPEEKESGDDALVL